MPRRLLLFLCCAGLSACGAAPGTRGSSSLALGGGGGGGVSISPPHLTAPQRHAAALQRRAVDKLLVRSSYISRGGHKRYIALTFDDGPGVDTERLLRILRGLHAHATFFQVGRSIRQFPTLARRELEQGYSIGDHTETHPFLRALSAAAQRHEILGAASVIRDYGAPYPRLFRPPYGSFDAHTLAITRAARMLMVLWSVDTRDFSRPGSRAIAYAAISGAQPGAIILMHDGGGPRPQTLAAVPRIVRALRRRNYKLVTVPQLLLHDPPRGRQPIPHDLSGR